MTTVSHRDPLVAWLRPRAPVPGGSYHAWVSLRPGPRALSTGRAWCPPGFIRQNGVCTGKTEPQPCPPGTHPAMLSQAPGLGVWAPHPCSETQGSQVSGVGGAGRWKPPCYKVSWSPGCAHRRGASIVDGVLSKPFDFRTLYPEGGQMFPGTHFENIPLGVQR